MYVFLSREARTAFNALAAPNDLVGFFVFARLNNMRIVIVTGFTLHYLRTPLSVRVIVARDAFEYLTLCLSPGMDSNAGAVSMAFFFLAFSTHLFWMVDIFRSSSFFNTIIIFMCTPSMIMFSTQAFCNF